MANASLQGEHIFNAVGDLALDRVRFLQGKATGAGAASALSAAQREATGFKRSRDNERFRSASVGDPANSGRYSEFAKQATRAIEQMVSDNPSTQTTGYTTFNRLIDRFEDSTFDAAAYASKKASFDVPLLKTQFDQWVASTRRELRSTLVALRDATLAVARTRQ